MTKWHIEVYPESPCNRFVVLYEILCALYCCLIALSLSALESKYVRSFGVFIESYIPKSRVSIFSQMTAHHSTPLTESPRLCGYGVLEAMLRWCRFEVQNLAKVNDYTADPTYPALPDYELEMSRRPSTSMLHSEVANRRNWRSQPRPKLFKGG